jgi:undecaprenyl-diphosphatase
MPEWISVIFLGLVEGLTEFLPVSSTGHLLLAEQWLPMQTELFNTVIQCGAVLAVILIFTRRLKQMIFEWRDSATQQFIAKLALAFILTAVGGLVLKKVLHFKLPEKAAPVAAATLIGGVLFLAVEHWVKKRPMSKNVTWKIAAAMGLAQLVAAAFPGTSRSGVTILTGLVFGLSRPAAAEFSFLLGIPTLLSAGAFQVYETFHHSEGGFVNWGMVGLGSLAAAITAFIVVKWLLRFVQNHTFVGFAWYRIILGILILTFVK